MTDKLKGSDCETRIQIRIDPELLQRYDSIVDNRSKHIREHIRRTCGETTKEIVPPSNDLLRNGWESLKQAADPNGKVPLTTAKARVAEATRVTKTDVSRTVLRPLAKRGYIYQETSHGPITVIGENDNNDR